MTNTETENIASETDFTEVENILENGPDYSRGRFCEEDARRYLEIITAPFEDNEAFEIRAQDRSKGMWTGYFTKADLEMALDLVRPDGSMRTGYLHSPPTSGEANFWITKNPLIPEVLARVNRRIEKSRGAATDSDVIRWIWTIIDFDPIRPTKDIPSTESELQKALNLMATVVRDHRRLWGLSDCHFFTLNSANGGHLYLLTPMTDKDRASTIASKILAYLRAKYPVEVTGVDIDDKVHNPCRVVKIAGTLGIKGDGDPATGRVHRVARLLQVPDRFEPLDVEKIGQLVDESMKEMEIPAKGGIRPGKPKVEVAVSEGWEVVKDMVSGGARRLTRPLPDIDFSGDRNSGTCSICGQSSRQCLSGVSADGHSWVVCWRKEGWRGTDGIDHMEMATSGMGRSAFFWDDCTPVFTEISAPAPIKPSTPIPAASAARQHKRISISHLPEGLFKDTARFIRQEALGTDEFAIVGALQVFSMLTRNRVRIEKNAVATESLGLYTLFLGPSGDARKSSTADCCQKLVRQAVGSRFPMATKYSIEAVGEALYKAPDKCFGAYQDEFTTIMGKTQKDYRAGIKEDLTELYNGSQIHFTFRKNKESMEVEDFQFNLIGASTDAWMFRDCPREYITGGFLPRFILAHADKDDPAIKLNVWDDPAKRCFQLAYGQIVARHDLVERLAGLHEVLGRDWLHSRALLTPEARQYMAKVNAAWRSRATDSKNEDAPASAIIARVLPNLVRVATLIEISKLPPVEREIAPLEEVAPVPKGFDSLESLTGRSVHEQDRDQVEDSDWSLGEPRILDVSLAACQEAWAILEPQAELFLEILDTKVHDSEIEGWAQKIKDAIAHSRTFAGQSQATWSSMMRATHLDAKRFEQAAGHLEALDEIAIHKDGKKKCITWARA